MDVNCYKYINLEYMDMMSDGDDSMKKIMLEMLIEELPMEIDKMESLSKESNWSEVGSVSHKLKSTLAFVGNEEMTSANKNIEAMTKEGKEYDEISKMIQSLKTACPDTMVELQQELGKF